MKRATFLTAALLILCATQPLRAEGEELPLTNPGFEEGIEGWTISKSRDPENVKVTDAVAIDGVKGLHVKDTDLSPAFAVTSTPLEIQSGAVYQVVFQGSSNGGGEGIGVRMAFYLDGKEMEAVNVPRYWPACLIKETQRFVIRARAPDGASTMRIVITSFSNPKAEAVLDGFSVTLVEAAPETAQ